jgi:hypothetical protein
VERYLGRLDHQVEKLDKSFESYFEALGDMAKEMNAYVSAANRGDRKGAGAAKSGITRQRTKALSAGKSIREVDRSLLAHRLDVPDDVIERLESDAELLGKVSRLISTDRADGFNEAAGRLNEVLGAWRKLLGK